MVSIGTLTNNEIILLQLYLCVHVSYNIMFLLKRHTYAAFFHMYN
jgi:hypothetical protein